jgi:DNA-binding MarR family transcriptional regulator
VRLGEGVDGRSRLITLTDAGRDRRQLAQRHWKAAQQRLNRVLGMERVHALHQLLDESMGLLADANQETLDE